MSEKKQLLNTTCYKYNKNFIDCLEHHNTIKYCGKYYFELFKCITYS